MRRTMNCGSVILLLLAEFLLTNHSTYAAYQGYGENLSYYSNEQTTVLPSPACLKEWSLCEKECSDCCPGLSCSCKFLQSQCRCQNERY